MKEVKIILVSLLVIVLLLSPFFMPDKWIYIEKCESVYDDTWEGGAVAMAYIIGVFFTIGVFSTIRDLFEDKKENN